MLSLPIFLVASVVKIVLVIFILLTAVAYTVWLERKVVGHMQNRWGPSRVGPFGLLQPLADGVKFLLKEDLTPPHVYRPLFIAAPMIAVICALVLVLRANSDSGAVALAERDNPNASIAARRTDGSLVSARAEDSDAWTGYTGWRWPDGRRTASIPCSADCGPARKW